MTEAELESNALSCFICSHSHSISPLFSEVEVDGECVCRT